jgi:metal-sulfur cluster biosynthetic enzyme
MGNIKEKVVDILKKCNDPELPIDLWNLGLIYDLNINQNGDNFDVSILMSLTTPGCTMGQYMMDDMKMKLATLQNIGNVEIELTFDPPWNPEMMTDEGKAKLGL